MTPEGSALTLAEVVHAAAAEPGRWPDAMARVSAELGGNAFFLGVGLRPGAVRHLFVHGLDAGAFRSYVLEDLSPEPWRRALEHMRAGELVAAPLLMTREQFHRTKFFRRFSDELSGEMLLVGLLDKDEDDGVTVVGLVPLRRGRKPGGRDERLLTLLLPHLRLAANAHLRAQRGEAEAALFGRVLDLLRLPTAILAGDGRVLYANRSAREVLGEVSETDGALAGGAARRRGGPDRLAPLRAIANDALNGKPTDPPYRLAEMRGEAPGRSLQLLALPLDPDPPEGGPRAAAVFIAGLEPGFDRHAGLLRSLYGLSPSEAGLALLLAQGKPLSEAAERQGITVSTARSRLKHVFAKTGAHRQAGLVSRILCGLTQVRWDD